MSTPPPAETPAQTPTAAVEAISPVMVASSAMQGESMAPGAGSPLVDGMPGSVTGPAPASRVNIYFGIGAAVLLALTVIVVILLAIVVVGILRQR